MVTTLEQIGPPIDRPAGASSKNKMSYKAKPEMKPSEFAPEAVNSGRSEMTLGIKARPPAPATLPNYLVDQMGKQISRSILRGDGIVRFQLKPPEMGTVRLEMDLQGNLLKLGVITENSSVKDLLLSSIQELKETLSGQGIKLEKLDVQIQQDFNQSPADSPDGLKGDGRSNRETGGSTHISDRDGIEEAALESAGLMQSDYLLDLMA